jgi:hypothetical protein
VHAPAFAVCAAGVCIPARLRACACLPCLGFLFGICAMRLGLHVLGHILPVSPNQICISTGASPAMGAYTWLCELVVQAWCRVARMLASTCLQCFLRASYRWVHFNQLMPVSTLHPRSP